MHSPKKSDQHKYLKYAITKRISNQSNKNKERGKWGNIFQHHDTKEDRKLIRTYLYYASTILYQVQIAYGRIEYEPKLNCDYNNSLQLILSNKIFRLKMKFDIV